jgi:hypothetical protein
MSESIFTYEEVPLGTGLRWFVKRGPKIVLSRGFASKADASAWIAELGERLDWRAGFVFRLRGDNTDMEIVNRHGIVANP